MNPSNGGSSFGVKVVSMALHFYLIYTPNLFWVGGRQGDADK